MDTTMEQEAPEQDHAGTMTQQVRLVISNIEQECLRQNSLKFPRLLCVHLHKSDLSNQFLFNICKSTQIVNTIKVYPFGNILQYFAMRESVAKYEKVLQIVKFLN